MMIKSDVFGVMCLVVLTLQGPAGAQELQKVTVSCCLNGPSAGLREIEMQIATLNTKAKAMGFGGAKASFKLEGDKSPIRIAPAQPQFVLKMAGISKVPDDFPFAQLFSLVAIKTAKGDRELPMSNVGAFGKIQSRETISCDVEKFEGDSLRIVPRQPLPPGEYAFQVPNDYRVVTGQLVYAFGIDVPQAR